MIKMIDVANHAGVSIKTVSRVVNNEPTVQPQYKAKVLKSIEHLGYVPSTSARALRSNRSYQISFISNSSRNTFSNRVLFGALQTCQEMGFQLVLELIEDSQQVKPEFIDGWINELSFRPKPEGVIALPPLSFNQRFVEKLIDLNIPVVNVGGASIHPKQMSVGIDDRAAASEVTKYLIKKGHRRIGHILGAIEQSATADRLEGYKAALEENGIPFDESLIFQGDFHFESGVRGGEYLLSKTERPSAIFSGNDEMASGVIVAAQKLGILVPDEVSLVGFDDNVLSCGFWPSLTTIRQPLEMFGETAMELIASMRGKSDVTDANSEMCLEYELIERHSVMDVNHINGKKPHEFKSPSIRLELSEVGEQK